MTWTIHYHPDVADDFKNNIATKDRDFIRKTLEKRLSQEPEKVGKPLRNKLSPYRRVRISKYRVIYKVEKQAVKVLVLAVDKREDIYGEVLKCLGLN